MAYLVAGKILRSTEIKSKLGQNESSLLLKNNVMYVEKHSCE